MEGALNYSQIDYMTGQANGMLANGVSLKELSDNKLNPYSDNGVGWLGALGWDGLLFDFKNGEYIEAAKALGANNFRIIVSHILPNIMSPLIVLATLNFGNAVLTTSGMGFLGIGAQPPTPEWGAMLSSGRQYLLVAPHVTSIIGLAILFLVLGLNLFGDGLRDILDPKLKSD